jgi:3-oxoacyl-[acyl-carrier-protein] synthase III
MPESALRPAPSTLPPAGRLGTAIAGLGVAVPAAVVSNTPIAARLGIDEDWIVQRTGVRERHVATAGERLWELAALAGRRALAEAGTGAGELDLVLVATFSNDELTPAASARVTAALGADRAAAIDVNAACSGFISALALAAAQLESGRAERALVIGADLMTRIVDPDDRATAALFADGAGAVVLNAAGSSRVGPVVLGADGAAGDLVQGWREEGVMRMQGQDTFRHAVARLCEVSLAAAEAAETRLEDLDLFVYHQANARILRAVGQRLGLPGDRVVDCIDRYGNTSAASIPLALDVARGEGRLRDGDRVLLAAFGAGLTWGATVVEWGEDDG